MNSACKNLFSPLTTGGQGDKMLMLTDPLILTQTVTAGSGGMGQLIRLRSSHRQLVREDRINIVVA